MFRRCGNLTGQNTGELVGIDIPPRHNTHDVARPGATGQRGRHGRRACPLRNDALAFRQPPDCGHYVRNGDDDRFIDEGRDERPHLRQDRAAADAVDEAGNALHALPAAIEARSGAAVSTSAP